MKRAKPSKKRLTPVPASRIGAAAPPATPQSRRIEVLTAVFITLWVAVLHLVYLFHGGPLWRDEAGTVDFAAMPSVAEIWRNLRYDNFPPLFVAVARVWTLAGLNTDFSYRLLGCLIGIGTLGAIWFCSRTMAGPAPLLVLALYAANPLAIRVGDSLRPYGLGIALTLLTAALIWNFVQSRTRKALFWAALAATLSVQCLYQNAFFIIAFSCAAWTVVLARKEWKTAWQTGIIGLAAAFSLLPYWANIKDSQEWFGISRQEIHIDAIGRALGEALRNPGGWMVWVWGALCVASLIAAIVNGVVKRSSLILYCGTILIVSAPVYLLFLRSLGLAPRPWYFLILLAPTALMLDSIWVEIASPRWRISRAVLAFVLVLGCGPASYAGVQLRETNIDLVAAKLKEAAQPGDLILVSPWFYGVSLQRYFDPARWTTLPPMKEIRIHRYDLMKKAMVEENPIGSLLDQVTATLRAGHTFWVLGVFQTPPPGNPQPVYPPYHGGMDMADSVYFSSWMFQISALVQNHSIEGGQVKVEVPGGQPVNPLEDVPLLAIRGWRE